MKRQGGTYLKEEGKDPVLVKGSVTEMPLDPAPRDADGERLDGRPNLLSRDVDEHKALTEKAERAEKKKAADARKTAANAGTPAGKENG